MSIKKLLVLSAAALVTASSAVAFAGGPDAMGPPTAAQPAPCVDMSSVFSPALYIDLDGGYAFQNWNQFVVSNSTVFSNTASSNSGFGITDNGYGGGTGLIDVGTQLFEHIGAEVGGIYLPKVTGPQDANGAGLPGASATQYNWAVYAAGKFSVNVPHVSGLSLFTKVGPVWRAMSNVGFAVSNFSGPHSYWTALYGAGFDYNLSGTAPMLTGFSVNLQWLGMPGYSGGDRYNNKTIATLQPADNLLTAGLGYQVAL